MDNEIFEVQNDEVVVDTTNLPSEKKTLNTEIRDDLIKDGKILGRWYNVDDMLNSYKEMEKTYTQYKTQESQVRREAQAKEETSVNQQNAINDMLPEFIASNYQITDAMLAKAREAGIDERDFKLGVYEIREQVNKANSIVGGPDEYSNMISWAKNNLPESQISSFNLEVSSGVKGAGEWAIKGLYGAYKQATSQGVAPEATRISGDAPSNISIKPYTTREELMADTYYVNTSQGQKDRTAVERYRQRLAISSVDVVRRS
jgi:hypothetical protein